MDNEYVFAFLGVNYIMDMTTELHIDKPAFELNLANFNGPLDFLLELVKVNKIEIRDIFISEVTEQFLQYMAQVSKLDVNEASDYMSMAATLLEIKCRSLLPKLDEDEEESNSEKILLKQLEEYKMFKEIVTELKEQETVNRFYRQPDETVGVAVEVPSDKLNMDGFIKAFEMFLAKASTRGATEKVSRAITKESYTIIDKIQFVQSALSEYGKMNFSMLFQPSSSRLEIVVTFSAILELLKGQAISVEQSQLFDDFVIVSRGNVDIDIPEEE